VNYFRRDAGFFVMNRNTITFTYDGGKYVLSA